MSEVIKRRGDEGQRGKERWRTEGDAGGKKEEREREREMGTEKVGTGTSVAFITPDWILPRNIFYYIKYLSLFCLKVYF